MYKYILEGISNINWLAVFALCTFLFVFFVGSFLILKKDKNHISHMSHMPLDNDVEI